MKDENLNTPLNSPLKQKDIKNCAFTITIDDTYCKWEFGFEPEKYVDLCIEDITKVVEEYFQTKMIYGKCIEVRLL